MANALVLAGSRRMTGPYSRVWPFSGAVVTTRTSARAVQGDIPASWVASVAPHPMISGLPIRATLSVAPERGSCHTYRTSAKRAVERMTRPFAGISPFDRDATSNSGMSERCRPRGRPGSLPARLDRSRHSSHQGSSARSGCQGLRSGGIEAEAWDGRKVLPQPLGTVGGRLGRAEREREREREPNVRTLVSPPDSVN